MVDLVRGNVTFRLTDDWRDANHSSGLNAKGRAFDAALTSIFAGPQSSAFLASLAGKTIYVIYGASDSQGNSPNNAAMYTADLNGSVGWPGGPTSSIQQDPYNKIAGSSVGNAPIPLSQQNFLFIGDNVLPSLSTPIATPSGSSSINAQRIIFHELAHAVTLPTREAANAFRGGGDGYYYEDVAIAAENYIYRRDFGGAVRVGHDSTLTNSFDPTLPFSGHSAAVHYTVGSNGDSLAQVFSQFRQDQESTLIKTYYSENYVPGSHGRYNNYVTVEAISAVSQLVDDGAGTVTRSATLNSVVSGVASHKPSDRIDDAVSARDAAKSGATEVLAWFRAVNVFDSDAIEWITGVSEFKLDDIYASKGLTNEASVSDSPRAGPYVRNTVERATYLEIVASSGSIIFGASGFNDKNVNFNRMADDIKGSDDKDLILVGKGSAPEIDGQMTRNKVDAGGGDDVIVGGEKNDLVLGGEGSDLIVASKGSDQLDGGAGRDTLIVGDDLNRAVIEVQSNGGVTLTSGTSGNERSVLTGFEMYVGGAQRVEFRQAVDINGSSPALFVAGSGGADFYLAKGGIAVGRDGVVDKFYLSDSVVEGFVGNRQEYLQSNLCVLVNVEPGDLVYLPSATNPNSWVLFNGAQVSSTLLPQLHNGSGDDTSSGGVQVTGTSTYGLEFAQAQLTADGYTYGHEGDIHQRSVNYIPLNSVASGYGIINFADYTENSEGRELHNYLNVIINYTPGTAGMTFTRDSLSPTRPFELPATFYDEHGGRLFFSGQYEVGLQYGDYSYYSLDSQDWDWFRPDERVFGYAEEPPQTEIEWAEAQGLVSDLDGYYGFSGIWNALDEGDSIDFSDSALIVQIFGEDSNSAANSDVTIYLDPLLGISTGGDFAFAGEWRQGGVAIESLQTALGALSITNSGVTFSEFTVDSSQTEGEAGVELDPGRITRGTLAPAIGGAAVRSHIAIVAAHFSARDEDARANLVAIGTVQGTLVGVDLGLGDFTFSLDSPDYAFTLVSDGGGAFAIDAQSGLVTVANTSALAALAGTTAVVTARISTVHGHRDTNFTIAVSGAFSYSSVSGTAGDDTLSGTNADEDMAGGDGDDLIVGGGGNDRLAGGAGTNVLSAGSGNDVLVGGDGDDILEGEAGSDVIAGNGGDNIIRFNLGDGYDLVLPNNGSSIAASTTILSFGPTIGVEDLTLMQSDDGRDLIIRVGTQGDQLVVDGLFSDAARYGSFGFLFNDSSSMSIEEIANQVATASGTSLIREAIGSQSSVLIGSQSSDELSGGADHDILAAGAGDDVLDGGGGGDYMAGGVGDDIYIVSHVEDNVVEDEDGGWDEVRTSLISYTAADNVEAITFTGTANFIGIGNARDNFFTGGAGNDAFSGGAGDDRYVIDQSGDEVIEQAHEGRDEILTQLSAYTLSAHVEVLTYTGSADFVGTGNGGDNSVSGGAGNDTLSGGAGDDFLDGGAGSDAMAGGSGNDSFTVDDMGDVVTELADEGRDTVVTSLNAYQLGSNVEDVMFAGTGHFSGMGNGLDNILAGGAGDDILDGAGGADRLAGGFGDDVYRIDNSGDVISEVASAGFDSVETMVSRVLEVNVESLRFVGTGTFEGIGNELDNTIAGGSDSDTLVGNDGDDYLDGGGDADSLAGGSGDDTYVVDDVGDMITETADHGTDTVETSLDAYALGANLEKLVATGGGDFEGTGNALDNAISGTNGINILAGGAGNDRYFIHGESTAIVEAINQGVDEAISYVSEYSLADNVENLTFGQDVIAVTGFGNALSNVITGSFEGSYLEGGAGDDIYYVFSSSDEVIELSGEGTDEIRFGDGYYFEGFFALPDHVERLTYIGENNFIGFGNALDNTISGSTANDMLDGGLGGDVMAGGTGDDIYFVDDAGDVVVEALDAGADFVRTSLNTYVIGSNVEGVTFVGWGNFSGTGGSGDDLLVGSGGDDSLVGGDGNDVLDGREGADFFQGGAGNDVYSVDNVADVVVELAGDGIDTVIAEVDYTLGNYVENITYSGNGDFLGTGNSLANRIEGGDGNDELNGLTGDDVLIGGKGDDVYFVDSSGDSIVELVRQGLDEVRTTLTSYTLTSGLENLTFVGTSAFTGVGNLDDNVLVGGSGDDNLTGGSGNDELHGGAGGDFLAGGAGNDSYYVDDVSDVVTEMPDGGTDTVYVTTSTFTLGANVEELNYAGSGSFVGTGNGLANVIKSGSDDDQVSGGGGDDDIQAFDGDDIVNGGDGNDLLRGGSGADIVYGDGGHDRIDGGYGVDTLYGGAGNDFYEIDDSDTVIESANEGIDTIWTYSHQYYTLGDNIENLQLDYWTNSWGTGNSLANVITGSWADNWLSGLSGNDHLIGGQGNDSLVGGEGDDDLEGGDGDDVAIFAGTRASYTVTFVGGDLRVVDNDGVAGGNDGIDTLSGIETLEFADGQLLVAELGNQAPVADGPFDPLLSNEDAAIDIALPAGSFVDPEGAPLSVTATLVGGDPLPGWLSFDGARFTGTPPANFNGSIALTLTASDGELSTAEPLELRIVSINDAPVADPFADVHAPEDQAVNLLLPEDLFSDVDGDTLTLGATLQSGNPLPSWLSFDGERFTGTPPANFNGSLGLRVTASDGTATASRDFNLIIDPVNDAPQLQQAIADVVWPTGAPQQITLPSGTFADVDGDSLTLSATLSNGSALPAWVTFDPATRTFSGTGPTAGGLTIRVTASDGQSTVSDLFDLSVSGVYANRIDGTGSNNTLNGTSAADEIYGLGGDDLLTGVGGNDLLDGGTGNDRLIGGAGADVLVGGDGFDWADYSTNGAALILDLYDGSRTTGHAVGDIFVGIESYVGTSFADTFYAGAGATIFDGGSSNFATADTVDYSLSSAGVTLTLAVDSNGLLQGTGTGGLAAGDTLFSIERVVGTSHDDVYAITGNATYSSQIVFVEASNGGSDEVRTDRASYTLGSNIEELTFIGTGAFTGTGNALANILTGGAGNDRLIGGAGADVLVGGDGFDWADYSTNGAALVLDLYDGSRTTGDAVGDTYSGIESYVGTSFADTFYAGATATIFDGGSSNFATADTVDYSLSNAGITLTLTAASNGLVQGTGTGGLAAGDTLYSIERVVGSGHDDVYTITGHVDYTAQVAFVEASGGGSDEVRTDRASYTLGSNIEELTFIGTGAFTGTGNALANILTGGAGNDRLIGGAGADVLVGGDGFDWADYSTNGAALVLDLYDGSRTTGDAVGDTYSGIESYVGTSFADTFYAGAGATIFDGGSSNFATADTVDYSLSSAGVTLTLAVDSNGLLQGTGTGGLAAGDTLFSIERVVGTSHDDVYAITGNATYSSQIVFVEASNGGSDEVRTDRASYTLGSNIEELTFIGTGTFTGTGNALANILTGGAGNDRLIGGAGGDTLAGGQGTDVAVFAGVQADYSIVTSGGTIQIVDNQASVDGDDGTDTVLGIEKAEFKGGVQVNLAAPIVLDLDGDGVELSEKSASSTRFDWNDDGVLDRGGWVGSGDGFLTIDRDGNGTVSGADELSFVNDKPNAKSDFDGLTAFDSNGDGRLSAADDRWGDFHVWKDADGDGIAAAAEYLSMTQAGVASIGLSASATSGTWGWDANIVVNTGGFVRTNGTSGQLADVAMNYDEGPLPRSNVGDAGSRGRGRFGLVRALLATTRGADGASLHRNPVARAIEQFDWAPASLAAERNLLTKTACRDFEAPGEASAMGPESGAVPSAFDSARQLIDASAAFAQTRPGLLTDAYAAEPIWNDQPHLSASQAWR